MARRDYISGSDLFHLSKKTDVAGIAPLSDRIQSFVGRSSQLLNDIGSFKDSIVSGATFDLYRSPLSTFYRDVFSGSVFNKIIRPLTRYHNRGVDLMMTSVKINELTVDSILGSATPDAAKRIFDSFDFFSSLNNKNSIRSWDLETWGNNAIWQYGYFDGSASAPVNRILAPSKQMLASFQSLNPSGIGLSSEDTITWKTIARIGKTVETSGRDSMFMGGGLAKIDGLVSPDVPLSSVDFQRGLDTLYDLRTYQDDSLVSLEGVTGKLTAAEKDFADTLYDTFYKKSRFGYNTEQFDEKTVQSFLTGNKNILSYLKTIDGRITDVDSFFANSERSFDIFAATKQLDAIGFSNVMRYLHKLPGAESILSENGTTPFQLETLARIFGSQYGASHDSGVDSENAYNLFFKNERGIKFRNYLRGQIYQSIKRGGTADPLNIKFGENGTRLFSVQSGFGASDNLFYFTESGGDRLTFAGAEAELVDGEYKFFGTHNTGSASIGRNRFYVAESLNKLDMSDLDEATMRTFKDALTGQAGSRHISDSLYHAVLRQEDAAADTTYLHIVGTKADISQKFGKTFTALGTDDVESFVNSKLGSEYLKRTGISRDMASFGKLFTTQLEYASRDRLAYDRALRSFTGGSPLVYDTVRSVESIVSGITDISRTQREGIIDFAFDNAIRISRGVAASDLPRATNVLGVDSVVGEKIANITDTVVKKMARSNGQYIAANVFENVRTLSELGNGGVAAVTGIIASIVDSVSKTYDPGLYDRASVKKQLANELQKTMIADIESLTGISAKEKAFSLTEKDLYRIDTRGMFSKLGARDYIDISLDRNGAYRLVNDISRSSIMNASDRNKAETASAIYKFIRNSNDPALASLRRNVTVSNDPLFLATQIQDSLREYRAAHEDAGRVAEETVRLERAFTPENVEEYIRPRISEYESAARSFTILPTKKSARNRILFDTLLPSRDEIVTKIETAYGTIEAGSGKKVLDLYNAARSENEALLSSIFSYIDENNIGYRIDAATKRISIANAAGTMVDVNLPVVGMRGGALSINTGGSSTLLSGALFSRDQRLAAGTSLGEAVSNTFSLSSRNQYHPERTAKENIFSYIRDISRQIQQGTAQLDYSLQESRVNLTVDLRESYKSLNSIARFNRDRFSSEFRRTFGLTENDMKADQYERYLDRLSRGSFSERERNILNRELPEVIRTIQSESDIENSLVSNFSQLTTSGRAAQMQEGKWMYDASNSAFDAYQNVSRGTNAQLARSYAFNIDRLNRVLDKYDGYVNPGSALLTERGFRSENRRLTLLGEEYATNVGLTTRISDTASLRADIGKISNDTYAAELGLTEESAKRAVHMAEAMSSTYENAATIDGRILDAIHRPIDVQRKKLTDDTILGMYHEIADETARSLLETKENILPLIKVEADGTVSVSYAGGIYANRGDNIFTRKDGTNIVSDLAKEEGTIRLGLFNEFGVAADKAEISRALSKYTFSGTGDVTDEAISFLRKNGYSAELYLERADMDSLVKLGLNMDEKHETQILMSALGSVDDTVSSTLRKVGLGDLVGRRLSATTFEDLISGRGNAFLAKHGMGSDFVSRLSDIGLSLESFGELLTKERYAPGKVLSLATGGAALVASSYAKKHSSDNQIFQQMYQLVADKDVSLKKRFGSAMGLKFDQRMGLLIPDELPKINAENLLSFVRGIEDKSLRDSMVDVLTQGEAVVGGVNVRSVVTQIYGAGKNRSSGSIYGYNSILNQGVALSDRELTQFSNARITEESMRKISMLYTPDEFVSRYGYLYDNGGVLRDPGQPIVEAFNRDIRNTVMYSPQERQAYLTAKKAGDTRAALESAPVTDKAAFNTLSREEREVARSLSEQYGAANVGVAAVRDVTEAANAQRASRANLKGDVAKLAGFNEQSLTDTPLVSDLSLNDPRSIKNRSAVINTVNDELGLTEKYLADNDGFARIAVPSSRVQMYQGELIKSPVDNAFNALRRTEEELRRAVAAENGIVSFESERQNQLREQFVSRQQRLVREINTFATGKDSPIRERSNVRMAFSARPSAIVEDKSLYESSLINGMTYRGEALSEYAKRTGTDPDVVVAGKDLFRDMGYISDTMSEKEINRRLNILSTEGVNAIVNRSPSNYAGSVQVARLYHSGSLAGSTAVYSQALAAKMKLDSDGDTAALIGNQYYGRGGKLISDLDQTKEAGIVSAKKARARVQELYQDYQNTVVNPNFISVQTNQAVNGLSRNEWLANATAKDFYSKIDANGNLVGATQGVTSAREANRLLMEFNAAKRSFIGSEFAQGTGITVDNFDTMLEDKGVRAQFLSAAGEDAERFLSLRDQRATMIAKMRQAYAGYIDRPLFQTYRLREMTRGVKNAEVFGYGLSMIHEGFLSPKNTATESIDTVDRFMSIWKDAYRGKEGWQPRMKEWARQYGGKMQGIEGFIKDNPEIGSLDKAGRETAYREFLAENTVDTLDELFKSNENRAMLAEFDAMFTRSSGIQSLKALERASAAAVNNADINQNTTLGRLAGTVRSEAARMDGDAIDKAAAVMMDAEASDIASKVRENQVIDNTIRVGEDIVEGSGRVLREASVPIANRAVETVKHMMGRRGALAIVGGLAAAGYIGGNPSIEEKPPAAIPTPKFTDASLYAQRGMDPRQGGYIINVNAQGPRGAANAADALATATNQSLPTDVNLSVNIKRDRDWSRDDVDRYLESAFS